MEQLKLSFEVTSAGYTSVELALLTPDEIYQRVDAELLSRLKEDRRIERKPAGIHAAELGEYLSMWANTVPHGGLVIVGQANDGEFLGCSGLDQNRINEVEKAAEWHCPQARIDSKRVPVLLRTGETDFVIVDAGLFLGQKHRFGSGPPPPAGRLHPLRGSKRRIQESVSRLHDFTVISLRGLREVPP
jgi:hypothetical protein